MDNHIYVWVVSLDVVDGRLDLGTAYVGGVVQHLALQVGQFNNVEVDDADGANAGQRQVDCGGRAQSAGADNQGFGTHQCALTFAANVAHDDVAAISFYLIWCEYYGLIGHGLDPPKFSRTSDVLSLRCAWANLDARFVNFC